MVISLVMVGVLMINELVTAGPGGGRLSGRAGASDGRRFMHRRGGGRLRLMHDGGARCQNEHCGGCK